jgi:hypothetical protein
MSLSTRSKATRQAISVIQQARDLPEKYPQKQVPNVRKFKVSVTSGYHPVLEKEGIKKREFEPLFVTEKYLNKSINSYVTHQFRRLNKHRSNPRVFWRICEHLQNRSSSYLTLVLHETLPGWHRNYEYGEIWEAIKGFRQLTLQHYECRRVGIPKADEGTRCLTIPTLSWRLYLHALLHFLQIWLSAYHHPSQHGFIPYRGTTTAWRQIHE